MSYGFVYALSNDSMPGIYKIGFTTKHPRARVQQLSASTACPLPFELIAFFDHPDSAYAERAIHQKLYDFRVNDNREFFNVPAEDLLNEFRSWTDPCYGVFYSRPLDDLVTLAYWERGEIV